MKKLLFVGVFGLSVIHSFSNTALNSWTQLSTIAPIISTRANLVNLAKNNVNNWINAININFVKQNMDVSIVANFINNDSIFHIDLQVIGDKNYNLTDSYLAQLFMGLNKQINITLEPYQLQLNAQELKGKVSVTDKKNKVFKALEFTEILKALSGNKVLKEAQDLLIKMGAVDQDMRLGKTKYDVKVDQQHITTLKAIIKKIGWPTIDKVGAQASHFAWLLVQHADFDLDLQKTVLQYLKTLKPDQFNPNEIAYLTDKILIQEGKKQIYGTQFKVDKDKNIVPEPISDYKELDKRRATLGLENFKSYLSKLYSIYGKKK
ncbi:MAG: hypothetical protein KC646_00175 [Candidatus Cloacimonetes bacterium]|nr:hypothetical protein [Candidatus Cloacimonadota bacterium]